MNNLVTNIPGFLVPPLVGWVLDQGNCPKEKATACNVTVPQNTSAHVDISNDCLKAWNTIFIATVVGSFLGCLSYALLGARHPVYNVKTSKGAKSIQ